MRDVLFRAAQQGAYFPIEEVVAQQQRLSATKMCWDKSQFSLLESPKPEIGDEQRLVIWPYPRGSADIIDRANCVDAFVEQRPHYRVVSEAALKADWLPEGDLIVFAPFDSLIPLVQTGISGRLQLFQRPITVCPAEMMLGYLYGHGVIELDVSSAAVFDTPKMIAKVDPQLLLLNGSVTSLLKAAQCSYISTFASHLAPLGVTGVSFWVAQDENEAVVVSMRLLEAGIHVVLRPFAASQGTGVTFLTSGVDSEIQVRAAIDDMTRAIGAKYKHLNAYPLTITPFVEPTKIDGRIADMRIFVVRNPDDHTLRAIPGMVRLAQVKFSARDFLDVAIAGTNLNAKPAHDAVPGQRVFALSEVEVLSALGISDAHLEAVCLAATTIWGKVIEQEVLAGHARSGLFAYGSVDFVMDNDGLFVPIEMNGANVGSHPAVHPEYLDRFGSAMASALVEAGL